MRTFGEPNVDGGWKCPICGTNEKKEVVLIGIDGTEEGNTLRAKQFHIDCLELRTDDEEACGGEKMLYMFYREVKDDPSIGPDSA